jgi:hypothetical protein
MDPAHTDVLVGVGRFILLYSPILYRAFYSLFTHMGNCMGNAVQEKKGEDRILSFHDTAGDDAMGAPAIDRCAELVNIKNNSNTFQEP